MDAIHGGLQQPILQEIGTAKAIDLSALNIKSVIVHRVPSCNASTSPECSNQPLALDTQAIAALQARITEAVGRTSNCVEMGITDSSESSTASQIANILSQKTIPTFVSVSSSLAYRLHQVQNLPTIPGGIMLAVQGRTGISQDEFVALIKAEVHDGFSFMNPTNIEFLSNLFLTQQQRLYKIGFFVRKEAIHPPSPDNFNVYVYDHNITKSGTDGAAKYFYLSFLGCAPIMNAKQLTEKFYNTTKDFITNVASFSPEKKVDLFNALHVYLKTDQSALINPEEFSGRYFPTPEIRDQYSSLLETINFPSTAIPKDITGIARRLRLRSIKFNSGVKITFPSSSDANKNRDMVEIEKYDVNSNMSYLRVQGEVSEQK
jgi:hypothetical protein